MTTVVFAGPSLTGTVKAGLAGLDLRPPAACGDVARAVRNGASTIALIDGVFEAARAPWHKELLWALSRGVRVYGASSMGALRAAEMHPFGMKGIGLVYRLYRTGAIADDDEVALVHGPPELDCAPLSEAMINVRATLRAARRGRVISEVVERKLATLAKDIFYKERTYPEIFRRARHARLTGLADLEGWVGGNARDVKRDDALALIGRLRLPERAVLHRPEFVRTRLWAMLEESHLAERPPGNTV